MGLLLSVLALLTGPPEVHVATATEFGPASVDRHNPNDALACARRVEGRPRALRGDELAVALPAWVADCGSWVTVCGERRCVEVQVLDRGPRRALACRRSGKRAAALCEPFGIDLTRPVAEAIGLHGKGLVSWWKSAGPKEVS